MYTRPRRRRRGRPRAQVAARVDLEPRELGGAGRPRLDVILRALRPRATRLRSTRHLPPRFKLRPRGAPAAEQRAALGAEFHEHKGETAHLLDAREVVALVRREVIALQPPDA